MSYPNIFFMIDNFEEVTAAGSHAERPSTLKRQRETCSRFIRHFTTSYRETLSLLPLHLSDSLTQSIANRLKGTMSAVVRRTVLDTPQPDLRPDLQPPYAVKHFRQAACYRSLLQCGNNKRSEYSAWLKTSDQHLCHVKLKSSWVLPPLAGSGHLRVQTGTGSVNVRDSMWETLQVVVVPSLTPQQMSRYKLLLVYWSVMWCFFSPFKNKLLHQHLVLLVDCRSKISPPGGNRWAAFWCCVS